MRSNISLYIGSLRAELDDDSLVLLNYAFEDLANPTTILNSYSRTVTLRGTPANNRIFGEAFRLDRHVTGVGGSTGTDFNAGKKTPFTLQNAAGEILMTGYVKLNRINRTGQDVTYDVTLFGGLGGFLYALAYDDAGNKRTLADLDYLGTQDSETELDFTINTQAVLDAWGTNMDAGDINSIWKVINFALAYNGIPQTKFAANKGLAAPTAIGLPADMGLYKPRSGYTLVTFPEAVDENAVKDLRSYLQRPVYSLRAFFAALSKPANAGGYTFDASILADETKFPYQKLWMTLPMLPSITVKPQIIESSVTLDSGMTYDPVVGEYTIGDDVPAGALVELSVHFSLEVKMTGEGVTEKSNLYTADSVQQSGQTIYTGTVFFIQALAYGTDGTLVGGSKVQTICDVPQINAEWMAVRVGYEPQLAGAGWDPVIQYQPFVRLGRGSDVFQFLHGFEFDFSGKNIDTVRVRVDAYQYEAVVEGSTIAVVFHSEGGIRDIRLYDDIDWDEFAATNAQITTDGGDTATITTSDTLRSGATVTKRQLLSTSKTPADYLVSFCKTFGLVLQYDDGAKKVTLLRRRDFFQNTTVDLTGRVVRSMESEITPVAFSAKWYRFLAEDVGGSFATQYADLYGRPYGEQRVNTGYDFNAEVRDLLDGYVFKGAAAILSKSRFNTFIRKGSGFIPSPFILNGCKYTMWTMTAAHEAASWDVPVPDDSYVINYFNQFPGYDFPGTYRPELRTEDNKPAGDGANVLLMHIGAVTLADYKLTDDVAAMDVLAEGSPCWFIQGGSGVTAQLFSRYRETVAGEISLALDFGVPAEIGIPSMTYDESATIYRKAWRPYIADKYDRNTKVLRCYVDLRGMRVGPELLRGFWYYGGSLWVLNKIENYSPTTPDPVSCEFVQVQDKAAYLAGQF